ncbi:MAG: hypothetical protein K0V04_24435 [Deltaproteobacteria bacterium]|nr:hypothetical protein [Deltaproteobacteria bacterium]
MTCSRSHRMRHAARHVAAAVLALGLGCTPTAPRVDAEASAATTDTAEQERVRIKGLMPRLLIHRQQHGQVEQLHDGSVAHTGDLVQISYMAAGNRNGVVVSLDGRGVVTLHHPPRPNADATLVARGLHALDHAYELDDAQSYERFVFITSGDEPIDVQTVITAARRLAARGPAARHSPLPLPERWEQRFVTLDKRP